MDQVLREEQAKLNEVESIIDSAAEASRVKGNALAKDIADFYPIDYEDVGRKKELIDQRKKAAADEAYYLEFKPSPYFGRLDLDREIGDNYELNTYYIGKKGLTIGSDVIIVDWRTPVGECYYAQNQTSFDVKGIVYSLALRRALNIQNAKLINYRTEFDGNTISLEGEVIDPFLITVLQDKRRQNRLTDIIRSIQANQNNIIRQPLGESFIVQGCAGSGKTMILLHRLSYLKFNNRRMPLAGVKIITPNPDFNAHINELSTELDIDTIQKFTVEEYYVDLINRFSRNPNISSVVSSESMLKPDLLGEIYSDSFISQLREQYHLYWTVVLDAVDETRLKASFKLHKIDYPVTDTHNAQVATSLETGVVRIIREFKLKANEIYRQVMRKALLKAYSDHGEEYTRTNYRHKLFLMLLFCFWYYKRPINMDTYLNIDEAQDISIAEYTLLRKILGDDCVFNLYGDINQSLFPEKSIMGWEELQGIISKKVFVLNEDYRNTLQITEYCNREFFAEIYPIGIKGEPVSELDLEQGIQWLVELKKTNPDYRVTIITHGDGASIRENLSLLLKGKDVSWYAVDDKKISILTVENAKGLEFEAVIVLCDGMEINEQYIAFTRALDHLCVVKDHVSSNLADMIPKEAE